MIVFATLGAAERRRLRRSDRTVAAPEPDPTPVTTGRVTLVDVGAPFEDEASARDWLGRAGEEDLLDDLAVVEDVLHSFRLVTADPYLNPIGRRNLLTARLGFGDGEQVAEGRWRDARELAPPRRPRERRAKILEPQARLAAALGARERQLVCEELALRAQLDIDYGRWREAALQVVVALDAAIAELARESRVADMAQRVDELRAQRTPAGEAAQAALSDSLTEQQRDAVSFTLGRIEAALRARAVARA